MTIKIIPNLFCSTTPPPLPLLKVANSLAQVVRAQQAQGARTTVAHLTLPSSAGIITSQVRTAVTSGAQVVITSAGTGSQARTTPTCSATINGKDGMITIKHPSVLFLSYANYLTFGLQEMRFLIKQITEI